MHTARLLIRPATPDDEEASWRFRRLPEVARWLAVDSTNRADHRERFTSPERLAKGLVVELEGVVAHELSHIKNYDILVSTLAVTLVGVVAIVADLGVRMMWFGMGRSRNDRGDAHSSGPLAVLALLGFALLILSPIIAKVLQATISRRRETLADVSAVELTRYPPGLISALEKLRDDYTVVGSTSHATAHLWIEQPQAVTEDEGKLSRLNRMFDTHPPLEERIALLREL